MKDPATGVGFHRTDVHALNLGRFDSEWSVRLLAEGSGYGHFSTRFKGSDAYPSIRTGVDRVCPSRPDVCTFSNLMEFLAAHGDVRASREDDNDQFVAGVRDPHGLPDLGTQQAEGAEVGRSFSGRNDQMIPPGGSVIDELENFDDMDLNSTDNRKNRVSSTIVSRPQEIDSDYYKNKS